MLIALNNSFVTVARLVQQISTKSESLILKREFYYISELQTTYVAYRVNIYEFHPFNSKKWYKKVSYLWAMLDKSS